MKERIKRNIIPMLLLTLGAAMLSAGVYFFRIPNNFVIGDTSGLAILLSGVFPHISKGVFVSIISVICLIIGILYFGKSFSWKTIYCSLAYSAFVLLLERIIGLEAPITNNQLVELILSVALGAAGAGVAIYAGGSTGGIEIIALIVSKKTHYSVGNALMVFNLSIAAFAGSVFGTEICLISIVGCLIHAVIIDKVTHWLESEKVMIIVAESETEICDYVTNTLDGCATVMNAVGAYSNSKNKFIMAVLEPKKALMLKGKIRSMKDKAFVVCMDTFEIMGGRR